MIWVSLSHIENKKGRKKHEKENSKIRNSKANRKNVP